MYREYKTNRINHLKIRKLLRWLNLNRHKNMLMESTEPKVKYIRENYIIEE